MANKTKCWEKRSYIKRERHRLTRKNSTDCRLRNCEGKDYDMVDVISLHLALHKHLDWRSAIICISMFPTYQSEIVFRKKFKKSSLHMEMVPMTQELLQTCKKRGPAVGRMEVFIVSKQNRLVHVKGLNKKLN